MLRRYIATFEYVENVRGESRTFRHESEIEARDETDAYDVALRYFGRLQTQSGVGWLRELRSCKVAVAAPGSIARGGQRIDADVEP